MSAAVSSEFINQLKDAVGEKNVITDGIGADFCHDEYPGGDYTPVAVVEAESTETVAAVMKLCCENAVGVTVRGAGTGQVGGSVPVKGGIVLSVKGMNKLLGYADGILKVQPGVLLQDVKAEAEAKGMYYPPDPGEGTATIGGNAATNAGGPCAVKYGKTRDYVESVVAVLADGSVETFSGSEALASIIGSEGTLAVITELSLKLIEKPGADAILLFPFADLESAVAGAKAILDKGFDPAVMELMDTDLVEFSGKVTGNPVFPVEMDGERVAATLMVTLEGADDDNVMEKMESVAEMTEEGELEPLDILVGDSITMKRDFWAAHSAFHTSMESGAKNAREVNIDVPMESIPEMIDLAKTVGAEYGLKVLLHAHLASGGMHIHAASDTLSREEFAPVFDGFAEKVYAKCVQLGGNVAGEYGVGYAKVKYLPEQTKAAHKALKTKLDPKGILNPGKISD